MPEPVPRVQRRDDTAADMTSLVAFGRAEAQPVPTPSISPFLEPDLPPPPADEPA